MATVWISPGAQATVRHLLETVDSLLPQGPGLLALLDRPVLVVVPSNIMQAHISARLAERGCRLGVRVITLSSLAAEILAQHGEIPRRGAAMSAVLTRRFAAQEPVLEADLGHLADGYSAVVDSVRDLLDAGFQPVHLDAADELLSKASNEESAIAAALGLPLPQAASTGDAGSTEQRAAAVLRIAAQVYEALEVLQVGERSWLYRRAEDLLPQTQPPGRAIWIAGFAEATGLVSDFIEGLMRWCDADVIVDRPGDPADPLREDAGGSFADVLLDRLSMVGPVRPLERSNPAPQRRLFSAPGMGAEIRGVARRIRLLLDGGVSPEEVGIVARSVELYRAALWRELRRMGIPFSGLDAIGSDSIESRRVGALLDVICDGPQVRVDRWLEACGWLTEQPGVDEREVNRLRRAELVMALSKIGVGRLHDIPTAVPAAMAEEGIPLVVRQGFGHDKDATRRGFYVKARHRILPRARLQRAMQRAMGLLAFLNAWPEKAPLRVHVRLLKSLLAHQLQWQGEPIAAREVADKTDAILRIHEGSLEMSMVEFRLLVVSQLRPIGRSKLGGDGGGVQVLSAIEARGITFRHLFVVGLNRDVFPKRQMEDALLSDRMRRRLHDLIPTLPLRAQTYLGERHLFAWLHTATQHITLSWQRTDDGGKSIQASPFIERFHFQSRDTLLVEEDPPTYGGIVPVGLELAFDAVVRAGLHGSRRRFARLLPIAMQEARGADGLVDLHAATAGRLRVLEALEPDMRDPERRSSFSRLDPYSGLVGPIEAALDPRRNNLYITVLEKTARCPWQAFLQQILRLEPVPDPIHDLPHVEKWMLGDLVHNVLEEVIRDALGDEAGARTDLDAALKMGTVPVRWPSDTELNHVIRSVSQENIRNMGVNLPGMALVMQDMAEPFLQVARDTDWPGAAEEIQVVGAEIEGSVPSFTGGRAIHFKADRADMVDGRLRLTDYKTGRPIDTGRRPETRARNFLKQVRAGQRLQAATYTLAATEGVHDKHGRFLFLNPDQEAHTRDFSVRTSDGDFIDATGNAFAAVIDGWDQGLFFPRLVEPSRNNQNSACKGCDFRQACRLGDSGYRRRLVSWATERAPALRDNTQTLSPQERALMRLWWLGQAIPKDRNPGSGK